MSQAQKTPIAAGLNRFAEKKIAEAFQLYGKSLPASVVSVVNSIVTVKFELTTGFTLPQITIPLFGPEYIRYPIQAGCKGVVLAMDASIGGMSGLGNVSAPNLAAPANLQALVFLPIANQQWSNTDDPLSLLHYGPNGVILRDTGKNSFVIVTPTGVTIIGKSSVTVESGSSVMTLNSNGTYSITGTTGTLQASNLTIQDGAHQTNPSTMNSAWAALVTWLNSHTHASGGAGAPSTPFSGGSIAP